MAHYRFPGLFRETSSDFFFFTDKREKVLLSNKKIEVWKDLAGEGCCLGI
jgi:hypothetical protein